MKRKLLIPNYLYSKGFRAAFKTLALFILPIGANASTPNLITHNNSSIIARIASDKAAITVKGSVVDASNGQPLIGVSINIKGTNKGTLSDIKGNFQLTNVPENAVLVITYISYEKVEIAVGGKTDIAVKLQPSMKTLSDVVVVGYGTQKKENLTGSVGIVNTQDLESRPLTNTSQALQGTVSGVFALQSSGKPGDDNTVIDIRGVGTFGDNSPLVLVDGFPGTIGDVNPNDVQSISVLKDAASSAIYGSRAANGVIVITTKRGSAGKVRVNYSGYAGIQSPTRLPKVLNSVQYTTLYNEAAVNTGSAPLYPDSIIQKYAAHNNPLYPDINYFDVYYGNAYMQNHRVSATGGSDNVNYSFMLGHLDQDGILVATNYKKTDFRLNLDSYHLKDKRLRVSGNISGNVGIKKRTDRPLECRMVCNSRPNPSA
ncbi:SusC/RagA family TonB-linked outer membrane protein [Mucilaginibacter sp.]|uniref:SusC/RagA family TonB-linked outer membrane protein n=1 Tax=Mucilaginibacter sp. TaxID=1882438 RepID=UPI002ED43566